MSESVVLHIPLSREYDALFTEARAQTDLRKCRCWFDRTAAVGDIRVEITDRDIGIRYETKKGIVEDRCVYSAVSALTELRRGIVVRLSHGRMLFLPSGGSREYMQALIRAVEILEAHICYRFRESSMVLPGVGLVTRLCFRFRPNRGLYFPRSHMDLWTKWSVIGLMCFTLFIATLFVTEPMRNQEITAEQVEPGTVLELLVHPDEAGVLQVVADGVVLLDFEGTMEVVRRNAVGFGWFGGFLYFCVAYVVYDVFLKKKKKKGK